MLFASSVAVTHRTLGTLDLVIIGIYFALVFGIGYYFSRKERTSEEYFLAGRNIGWFAIGASLFVSNISTEHFIGLAGSGATSGLAVGHLHDRRRLPTGTEQGKTDTWRKHEKAAAIPADWCGRRDG